MYQVLLKSSIRCLSISVSAYLYLPLPSYMIAYLYMAVCPSKKWRSLWVLRVLHSDGKRRKEYTGKPKLQRWCVRYMSLGVSKFFFGFLHFWFCHTSMYILSSSSLCLCVPVTSVCVSVYQCESFRGVIQSRALLKMFWCSDTRLFHAHNTWQYMCIQLYLQALRFD